MKITVVWWGKENCNKNLLTWMYLKDRDNQTDKLIDDNKNKNVIMDSLRFLDLATGQKKL